MKEILTIIGIAVFSLILFVAGMFLVYSTNSKTTSSTTTAGSTIAQQYGTPFQATDSYAGSGQASTTLAAVAGKTYYLTDISASAGTGGATVEVEDGSTVIWEAFIASSTPYDHAFVNPIRTTAGNQLYVFTSGTSNELINVSGYSYP